jgi:hypothetical protein
VNFSSRVHLSFTCLGKHDRAWGLSALAPERGTTVNETAVNPEKLGKAKELALGFIDQAWINTLSHPLIIFILVFAVAVLFLARTGLWRGGQTRSEAARPQAQVSHPVSPTFASAAIARVPPAFVMPAAGGVPIETLIAHQHAETAARSDRALALSEEALRLHAAALEELTRMNDTLARLVQQVDGAQAGVAEEPA